MRGNQTSKRYEVRVSYATFHHTFPKTRIGTLLVEVSGSEARVSRSNIDPIDLSENFPGLEREVVRASNIQARDAVLKLQHDPRWPITWDEETGIETHIVGQID